MSTTVPTPIRGKVYKYKVDGHQPKLVMQYEGVSFKDFCRQKGERFELQPFNQTRGYLHIMEEESPGALWKVWGIWVPTGTWITNVIRAESARLGKSVILEQVGLVLRHINVD